MLLNKETMDKFGYDTCDLATGSRKKVVVKCDYCEESYETTMKIYNTGQKKFPKDACKKCRFKKREEVSLERDGVKNSSQRQDVRQKIKDSKKRVDEQAALKKRRETCLEKYGAENIAQSDHSKAKYKETCMEKYGVENASSVEEFKKKRKQTNKERYGHEYYLGSQDCQDRVKEKYGVDNVFQLEEVKEKSGQTSLEKYGETHFMKVKENVDSVIQKTIETKKKNGQIHVYDGLSKVEWAKVTGLSRSYFSTLVNKYGWDYAVNYEKSMTNIEQLIFNHLTELGIQFEYNKKLGKFYPDFLIPDHNLIIEVDGLFWHSDQVQEDDNYHIKKQAEYVKMGYTPLFFREDEVLNKFDIVKSIINNKLGLSKRLFARKLTIGKLSSADSATFFNENHLMGNGQGQTFTLLENDTPVCAIKMRRRKNRNWEVSRFCPKVGYSIVGGFSKLLAAFEREHSPHQLMTFIDKRYGFGEYLSNLGFELQSCHKSFRWTDGQNSYHRMKCPSNTGYEQGLAKIWDCGQARWVKVFGV